MAIALVVAGVIAWLVLRPEPVSLTVDGAPIANPGMILADAEAALARIVAADDSSTVEGTACFFAPDDTGSRGPQVACGPVLLGISSPDQPWLVGGVSWGFGEDAVPGDFTDFDGTTTGAPGQLVRPDSRGPSETNAGDLAVPTTGLRTVDGERIVNDTDVLGPAAGALDRAATAEGAATTERTDCWYATRVDGQGRTTTDGTLWCGPVLTLDSDPTAPWVQARASISRGELLSTATATPPDDIDLRTQPIDPDVQLWRPDGRPPPTDIDLELPDAPPVDPGFATVLAGSTDLAGATVPDDGLLITPDMTWTIDGLAAVEKVGSGPEAVVAPDGHQLLVANSTFSSEESFFDPGVATLVVDGRRRPFEDWTRVDADTGAVVVSVPDDAGEVLVEVLDQEVTQSISLRTGARQPGFPAGLYRSSEPVGVGQSLSITVNLPAGDPAGAEATVRAVTLRGHDDQLGSPGPDEVFAVVDFASLDAQRPCCELDDLEVVAIPTMSVGGDPARLVDQGFDDATFVIPADATTLEVGLDVEATWTGGPGATDARASSDPVTVEVPQ